MAKFVPYTGGAGPTEEQAQENTRALAEAAGAELVWRKMLHVGLHPVVLMAEKNGRCCDYDRWGFASDGPLGAEGLDQASFEHAIEWLNDPRPPSVEYLKWNEEMQPVVKKEDK